MLEWQATDNHCSQGTLSEGGRLGTVDLLIQEACFVKKQIIFAISKAADLNKEVNLT